jgi:phosphoenolpyruvate carboxylase
VLADASKWLGTSLKADPFATNEMLRKALQGKREALGGLCLEKQESEVARLSLESQKSREEEEIQHLLLQLKEKDGLLRSECGSLPFPAAYEKVEKNYSKQQGIYKQIEASQFVIEGYEKVFLEKHYCALCERSFSSEAERLTFHNKVECHVN